MKVLTNKEKLYLKSLIDLAEKVGKKRREFKEQFINDNGEITRIKRIYLRGVIDDSETDPVWKSSNELINSWKQWYLTHSKE